MSHRIKKKTSLFAPAGNLLKRLSNTDARVRRRLFKIGLALAALFFLYSFMSGTYGITRIIRLEMERSELIAANQRQLVELIDAVRVRKMLQSDPNYIEYIARTRYHMAYPNEVIFRFRGQ
ncbi:MAG: septum formation initiator family protein [candidate division Zixibacteria bacterium]|nr:septum formation initiator family protein [candidate division Zixibacteria bacterium]